MGRYVEEDVRFAADAVRRGGLVAFPTETVYGLGGNALDSTVVDKIYEAKGRPSDNPLILHVARWEDVVPLVSVMPEGARRLAEAFWPGPLTIVLRKGDAVPKKVTGGRDTVAVRVPNHPVALDLIRLAGVPVAAPSANTSGRPSPTTAGHVKEDLDGRIDVIVDGGAVGIGIESTIIDMSEDEPTILRPGYITRSALEGVVGRTRRDETGEPKAPGMKYRHYAPRGELTIWEGDAAAVVREINRAVEGKPNGSVGVLASEETKGEYRCGVVCSLGARSDEEAMARSLYRVLREFDEKGIQYIYSESFDSEGLGGAVMNRLAKAADGRIIRMNGNKEKG